MNRTFKKRLSLLLSFFMMLGLVPAALAADIFQTTDRVNFRTGPSLDANIIRTLEPGTDVEALEYDPADWSKVAINGTAGYIRSDYLSRSIQNVQERAAAPAGGSMAFRTAARVNFRTSPSLDAGIIRTLEPGTDVEALEYDPADWSKVAISGTAGYIRSDYLARSVQNVQERAAAPAESSMTFKTTARVNFRTGPSLDADIIRLLDAGTDVQALEYDPNGWSKVSEDGTVGYIRSDFLFRSDSSGAGNSDAELLEWSVVKTIIKNYSPIQVVDVRTGTSYSIQSFSFKNHADVEPLTKADTDIIHGLYGGAWSWDPRPVLVTISGRKVAAAINGMPHGGGTIADNGMSGQICLHFYGSTTHNGNTSYEKTLQDAVMESWNSR